LVPQILLILEQSSWGAPAVLQSFLAVVQFEAPKVYVDFFDNLYPSIVGVPFSNSLLSGHFHQFVGRMGANLLAGPVGGRRHQKGHELGVRILGLFSIFFLFVQFLLHKAEKLVH